MKCNVETIKLLSDWAQQVEVALRYENLHWGKTVGLEKKRRSPLELTVLHQDSPYHYLPTEQKCRSLLCLRFWGFKAV